MTVLTVATFNIYRRLSNARAWDDLLDLLDVASLDVAGLNEIDWTIDPAALPSGWEVFQPSGREARKDPILTSGRILASGHVRISERIQNDGGTVPGRFGVWAFIEADGQRFIYICCHLNAGVEETPGTPEELPRQREHHQSLLALVSLADKLQATYDVPVIIGGDFNVDYAADRRVQHPEFPYTILTAAGFTCCWELGEQSTRSHKPHTGRTIDHLWVRGTTQLEPVFQVLEFVNVHTPNQWAPGDPVESDHLAVIAQIEFTPRQVETPREEPDVTVQPPSPPYLGPAPHQGARTNHPIKRIVMHCTAGAEPGSHNAARNTVAYTKRSGVKSSYHYCADSRESVQLVYDSWVAWHDGTNSHSIGYELSCSLAARGLGHWRKTDHKAMLKIAAEDVARLCLAYDIPIRKLTRTQIRAGAKGLCGHVDMRDAFPGSTTHWDPGPFFPWRRFLDMVRAAASKLTTEGDWFDMATADELRQIVREEIQNAEVVKPPNDLIGDDTEPTAKLPNALTRIWRKVVDLENATRLQ